MKTNKMLPDSSISKVWENFRKMNGIVLTIPASNWTSQSDGTFKNTVYYEGFTSDSILEIDLYDDGNLTETQISEYDGYITEFNVEDGKIVAIATTLPTQPIKILARGEIVGEKVIVNGGGSSDISASNVSCLDKDGNKSTVQTEIDKQNKKIGNVFSYEEVKTNDVWVDGKPVYRKTYDCGNLPNNAIKNIAHGLTNFSTMMIDQSHTYATDTSNNIPIPFVGDALIGMIKLNITPTHILIQTNQDRSSMKGIVTLLYTKTTD